MEGTNEHPSSSLGHSEELSVENPVGPPVPEFAQATEERPKVFASMRGEESRYVFDEDGGRSVALHKVKEGEGEAAALSGESAALAGDGEVLAGEAAGPEGGGWNTNIARSLIGFAASIGFPFSSIWMYGSSKSPLVRISKGGDVSEVWDSGPSLCEDGAGVGVDLGEADGAPSGLLKSEVESSDAGEE